MVNIHPYDRIGKWPLNQTREELLILAKQSESNTEVYRGLVVEYFDGLITAEFHHNISMFIGVHISLDPIHEKFAFASKSHQQVVEYFSKFGKGIYIENDIMIVSTDLGITVYFEDGIKKYFPKEKRKLPGSRSGRRSQKETE